MKQVVINFENIETRTQFYQVAARELSFPAHFGKNLDALWDVLSGEIELPVQVRFENLTLEKLEKFDSIISVFEEACEELGNDFRFEYYLKKED